MCNRTIWESCVDYAPTKLAKLIQAQLQFLRLFLIDERPTLRYPSLSFQNSYKYSKYIHCLIGLYFKFSVSKFCNSTDLCVHTGQKRRLVILNKNIYTNWVCHAFLYLYIYVHTFAQCFIPIFDHFKGYYYACNTILNSKICQ